METLMETETSIQPSSQNTDEEMTDVAASTSTTSIVNTTTPPSTTNPDQTEQQKDSSSSNDSIGNGVELKQNLREYVDIAENLRSVADDVKVLKQRQKELEELIVNDMEKLGITHLKIPHGTISRVKKQQLATVNRKRIMEILSTKINQDLADEITKCVFDKRPVIDTKNKIEFKPVKKT